MKLRYRNIIVALPFCNLRLQSKKPLGKAYPKEIMFLGDAIRKRRLDLRLLQKEVAAIFGCTEDTITNWELNRTSPQIAHTGKVVAFLGHDPFPEGSTLAKRLVKYRKIRGICQKDFARELGIDPSTLASYEQGRKPVGKFLELIERTLPKIETPP